MRCTEGKENAAARCVIAPKGAMEAGLGDLYLQLDRGAADIAARVDTFGNLGGYEDWRSAAIRCER
jgi:hypothetical protein